MSITPSTPAVIPASPAVPAITTSAVWIHNLTISAADPNRPVKVTGYTSQVGVNPVTNKLVSAPGTQRKVNVNDLYSATVALTDAQTTALTTALTGLSTGQLLTAAHEVICQAVAALIATPAPAPVATTTATASAPATPVTPAATTTTATPAAPAAAATPATPATPAS
jgi:hypothetical protein